MVQPTMTIRAPSDLQKQLSNIAEKQGLTRNALVLVILQAWLKAQEKGATP